MAQKTISASGSSWTGSSSADQVYINLADRVRLNTGGGNDSIFNNFGWYDTIDAGDKGAQLFLYTSGDGNDVIYNWSANDTLQITGGTYTRSTVGNDVVVKVGYGSITLKNAKNSTLNISNLSSSADLVSSADLASDDWISADDNNFVTNDTRPDSIVETTATDYSVGKLYSATTSLTPRNIFVAFTGKK